jgi:hypothetical protein
LAPLRSKLDSNGGRGVARAKATGVLLIAGKYGASRVWVFGSTVMLMPDVI